MCLEQCKDLSGNCHRGMFASINPNHYYNLNISKVLFMHLPHPKMHEVSSLRLQRLSENVCLKHDITLLNDR